MTDSTELVDIFPRDLTAGRNWPRSGDEVPVIGIASMDTIENGFRKGGMGMRMTVLRSLCAKNGDRQ